ncbi:uncharacterized protein LOC101852401 [Aplysia californica]|uniref:Uncharacterized protein LOC101852401 n=1 Tax=Aplysia californica TaxID=6500 RepID=A0ABM0JL36_APLCA|nr:uncharacterized protein LOC101852401 [Aplysia californica]
MMPKNMKTCLLFLVIALLAHTSAHRLSNLFYLRYLPPSPQNVDRSADTTTDTQDRELGTSPDTLVVDNLLNNIGTNHPIYKPSPVDKSGTGVNGADRSRMFNGDGTPNGNRAGMLPFRPQAVVPVNTDRAGGNTVDDMLSNLMSSRPTYIVDRDRDIGGPDPTDPQLPSGQPSNPAPSPSLPLPMPVAPVYPGRSKNSNGAVIITDNGAVFLRNSKTDPKAVTENVATPDDRDGNNNSTFVEPIVNDKPFEAANLDKWLNPDKETGKTSHSNEEDTTKDSDNSSNSSDDSDDDNSSNSKDDSEERGESGRSLNFPLNREFTVPPFSPYSGFDKDDNNNEQDENKKEILSVNGE